MHQRDGRGEALVGQIGVDLGQLRGRQHTLVDQRAGRQRREIDARLETCPAAQREDQPVEIDAAGVFAVADEQQHHVRHDAQRDRAERLGAHRHLTPAVYLEAFLEGDLLDRDHRHLAFGFVGGQVGHTHRVLPHRGQHEIDSFAQESVRNLDENTRAVTGRRVGAGRAAVVEIGQSRQAVQNQLMGGLAVELGNEGYAARVVLVAGIVEPLPAGYRTCRSHLHSCLGAAR